MVRNIYVNGETLVRVKGGTHMSGSPISRLSELGLSTGPIVISPRFNHSEIKTDDYGTTRQGKGLNSTPAEIQWNLASVDISMTLVHFDSPVMDICWAESMGGLRQEIVVPLDPPLQFFPPGMMVGAGSTLGHGLPMYSSGCHFISLNLASPQEQTPWRFRTCYLSAPPLEFPLGTERSLVKLQWRAIPYCPLYHFKSGFDAISSLGEIMIEGRVYEPQAIKSSGIVLWDFEEDTPGDVRFP